MSGYLTHWRKAEDSPAGRILEAISRAGNRYHHTEDWRDDDLGEPVADMIERVVREEVRALQEKAAYADSLPEDADMHRRIMMALSEIMGRAPCLRVCQIIGNAIPHEELERRNNDIYYIEDKELLGYLRSFEEFLLNQEREEKIDG